jgi:acetyltransferase-like isoleucine patch superfamily enzyme
MEYRNVEVAPVHFGRHTGLASCSIVMPGVTIAEGALVVGAFSFVNSSLDEWAFYSGRPARRLRERPRDALELEARMKREQ